MTVVESMHHCMSIFAGEFTIYEVNEVPLIKREGSDHFQYSYTGNNSHLQITRTGEIIQWKFYSTYAGRGRFMVWRPRPDLGPYQ